MKICLGVVKCMRRNKKVCLSVGIFFYWATCSGNSKEFSFSKESDSDDDTGVQKSGIGTPIVGSLTSLAGSSSQQFMLIL